MSTAAFRSMPQDEREDILRNESVAIPLDHVLPLLREHAYGSMPSYHDLTEDIRGRDRVLVNGDGLVVYSDFGFGEPARIFSPKTLTFGRQPFCVCCHARAAWFGKTAVYHGSSYHYIIDMFSDSRDMFTKDHIEPKILGGRDVMGNLVTCCYSCNIMKGNVDLPWARIVDVLLSTEDPEEARVILGMPKGAVRRIHKCMVRMRRNLARESVQQPIMDDMMCS